MNLLKGYLDVSQKAKRHNRQAGRSREQHPGRNGTKWSRFPQVFSVVDAFGKGEHIAANRKQVEAQPRQHAPRRWKPPWNSDHCVLRTWSCHDFERLGIHPEIEVNVTSHKEVRTYRCCAVERLYSSYTFSSLLQRL